MLKHDIIEFLKSRPDVTVDYIDYMLECTQNRAQAAWDAKMSLKEYEEKMTKELLELVKNKEG